MIALLAEQHDPRSSWVDAEDKSTGQRASQGVRSQTNNRKQVPFHAAVS